MFSNDQRQFSNELDPVLWSRNTEHEPACADLRLLCVPYTVPSRDEEDE